MGQDYPFYKNKKISNINSLSLTLDIPLENLINISENADNYYHENKAIIKPNGKKRVTYSIENKLKSIHERIKINIFQNVNFPNYLQGGIKADKVSRDYINDAALHSHNKYFINEDVSNFFPSITSQNVYKMWLYFFKFSKPVSTLLTKLTTYQGSVPQGSKTSSYIANLIFWKQEGDLVKKFQLKGLVYTRFIDDITVSSKNYISNSNKSYIIRNLYGMMLSNGVRPNRSKHFIGSSKDRVQIHNINVGSKPPSFGKRKINNIRMAVYNCIKTAHTNGTVGKNYLFLYRSTMSKLGQMGRLHAKRSSKYKHMLIQFKPTRP